MSLLDTYFNENIVVYPAEKVVDADGNPMYRVATVGVPTRARIQVAAQSGTSARRAEQDEEGYETEEMFVVRLPREFQILDPRAQIEWNGLRYSVFGHPKRYNGSRRTRRVEYQLRRT